MIFGCAAETEVPFKTGDPYHNPNDAVSGDPDPVSEGDEEGSPVRGGDGDSDADADADADADGDFDVCADGTCDVYEQCGCGAQEACDFDADGATGCFTAGPGLQDDSCEVDACAPGLTCVGSESGWACVRYCDGEHRCPEGSECIRELIGEGNAILSRVCWTLTSCDPVLDDCGAGRTCRLFGSQGLTDCGVVGTTPIDGVCSSSDECVAGASCFTNVGSDVGHCLEHCDASAPRCPAGHVCSPIDDDTTIGICDR